MRTVAQVRRDGREQGDPARVLPDVAVVPIDGASSRRIGGLLPARGAADLVAAHVALRGATGDRVPTGGRGNTDGLRCVRKVQALLVAV